jgi:hypothetical protein
MRGSPRIASKILPRVLTRARGGVVCPQEEEGAMGNELGQQSSRLAEPKEIETIKALQKRLATAFNEGTDIPALERLWAAASAAQARGIPLFGPSYPPDGSNIGIPLGAGLAVGL